MAKKKTVGPDTPGEPTSTTSRRRATPGATRTRAARPEAGGVQPGVTAAATVIDSAADMSLGASSSDSAASREPSFDEIAELAYRRYLERGGEHGRDFEDWVEAERRLRTGR